MKKSNELGKILFIGYVVILIWILLFKFSLSFDDVASQFNNQPRNINLVPFKDSVMLNKMIDLSEIINNIIIFIPFGGLLGIVDKKNSFWFKVLVMFLFSIVIEIFQYIFGLGVTDVTDVITNLTGGIIGLLIYQLLKLIIKESKLDKFLVLFGTILFSVCVGFILILLFINN